MDRSTKVRMPPTVDSVSRRFSRSMPIRAPIRMAMPKLWKSARSRSIVIMLARLSSLGRAVRRSTERDELVVGIVADVGSPQITNAGDLAPVPDDIDFGLAEIRIVRRNRAAAAEPDAGHAPNGRTTRNVEQRAVDPVHVLRDLFEHQHVIREVGLQGGADQDRKSVV